jgi:threonyl-tRNA synthetase
MFQTLIAYMRRRLGRRLPGGQRAADPRQVAVGNLRPLGLVPREHVRVTVGRRRHRGARVFALKPMNCPGHVQIFKHGLKSYRDLPLRLPNSAWCHRYEPSGALHGLMRVRGFTQDDAHIFCTEEQMADECLKINDLILSVYKDFGFDGEVTVKLSTGRTSASAPTRCGTTPSA